MVRLIKVIFIDAFQSTCLKDTMWSSIVPTYPLLYAPFTPLADMSWQDNIYNRTECPMGHFIDNDIVYI